MSIRFHRIKPAAKAHLAMSRRMFLMTTTMAGVGTGGLLGGARLALAAPLEDQGATLLAMVQAIYPHPGLLEVRHYQAIVDTVLQAAADNEETAAALLDGLNRIDALSHELHGVPFTGIADPDAREGLLRHFQNEGFFQNLRWTAYFGIYNNKEIWPLFGYEGSSVEYGGYIDRGFSDITFVPPGPTLEQRLAEVQK